MVDGGCGCNHKFPLRPQFVLHCLHKEEAERGGRERRRQKGAGGGQRERRAMRSTNRFGGANRDCRAPQQLRTRDVLPLTKNRECSFMFPWHRGPEKTRSRPEWRLLRRETERKLLCLSRSSVHLHPHPPPFPSLPSSPPYTLIMYASQQSTSLFLGGERTSGQTIRDQNGNKSDTPLHRLAGPKMHDPVNSSLSTSISCMQPAVDWMLRRVPHMHRRTSQQTTYRMPLMKMLMDGSSCENNSRSDLSKASDY